MVVNIVPFALNQSQVFVLVSLKCVLIVVVDLYLLFHL